MSMFSNYLNKVQKGQNAPFQLNQSEDPLDEAVSTDEAEAGEDETPEEEVPADPENEMTPEEDAYVNAPEIVGEDEGEPENDELETTPLEPEDGEPAILPDEDGEPAPADESEVDFSSEEEEAEGEDESEDETDEESAKDSDDAEKDAEELESMYQELSQLSAAQVAIESYGFHKSTYRVMEITGLLSGTALESMGMEAFGVGDAKLEAEMALESIGAKIKEKSAQWAAKILKFAKSIKDRVGDALSAIWEKVSNLTKKLATASWDAVKSAGKTIKAHPYKTIALVVAAIAAAAGVYAFAGSNMPVLTAGVDKINSFTNALAGKINAIKWPFGSVTAKVTEAAAKAGGKLSKISVSFGKGASSVGTATLDKLGWMSSSVKALGASAGRAFKVAGAGVKSFGHRAADVYDKFCDVLGAGAMGATKRTYELTGSGAATAGAFVVSTAAVGAIAGVIVNTLLLIGIKIIVGGFRIIAKTLGAIARAVGIGGGDSAEPAAA